MKRKLTSKRKPEDVLRQHIPVMMFSKAIGKTRQSTYWRVKNGHLPKPSPGGFAIDELLQKLDAILDENMTLRQALTKAQGAAQVPELQQIKCELERERLARVRLDAAERAGQLVDMAEIDEVMLDFFITCRDKFQYVAQDIIYKTGLPDALYPAIQKRVDTAWNWICGEMERKFPTIRKDLQNESKQPQKTMAPIADSADDGHAGADGQGRPG